MGFLFAACPFGFVIGFESRQATLQCLAASAILVLTFSGLRLAGASPALLRPFATGAMVLGNVMYFLALLILSHRSRLTSDHGGGAYMLSNGLMLTSLLCALLVGFVFGVDAMRNTAATFFVLWLMEKQIEIDWGAAWLVVVFANCVALFFLAHYLHVHPEILPSLVDPASVYLAPHRA